MLFASNFSSDKTTGEIPMTVQFTDSSEVFGANIDEWQWDFGDGTSSNQQNPSHTFITPSLYSVNLTIVNTTYNLVSSKFLDIRVFDELFATDFSASPYTYTNVNNPLNFNATVSSGVATGWLWDFDGGTDIDAMTISASKTYTTTGNYSVNFTVYNDIGSYSLIKPNYIRVFGPGVPYAQFSALTTTGTPGAFISFTDQSLYGTSSGLICNWSFGDSIYTISPYSSDCGDVSHVYTYAGVYDVSLNITNANGTSVETKKQYIQISTDQQTQTTFYTPRTIQMHITDVYGNSLIGATVNANFNQSTLPEGWLVSNFGMNEAAANQAMNGTLIMSGFSSTTGDVGFVMNSAIGYDITVSYGGDTNSYFIYPTSSIYNLRFISNTPTTTTTTDLFAEGNTKTWFTTPDIGNVTLWWSFQDTSGLTTKVEYFVVDFADNSTILYNNTLNSPGTFQYLLNWTEPNVRGNQRIWYMNITRSV
jgi:PKD repeat protein